MKQLSEKSERFNIGKLLISIQKRLIETDFSYTECDADKWPHTQVTMTDGMELLLISSWPSDDNESLRTKWMNIHQENKISGMVLAGTLPIDDEEINLLFNDAIGAICYISTDDPTVVRRSSEKNNKFPNILQKNNFEKILDEYYINEDSIDCMEELAKSEEKISKISGFRSALLTNIRDTIPYITYTLIAICVIVFILNLVFSDDSYYSSGLIVTIGACAKEKILQGEWWRIISFAFIHKDFAHVGFNMMALYYLGSETEQFHGKTRLLLVFLVSSIFSAALAIFPNDGKWLIGASGGIFGFIGMTLATLLKHRSDFPPAIHKEMLSSIIKMLLINFVISLLPGISMLAHIGGLISGFAIGMLVSVSPIRTIMPFTRNEYLKITLLLIAVIILTILSVLH